MKRLKQVYIIPILLSLVTALLLGYFLFPSEFYQKAFLSVLVPLTILMVGFRMITYQRIRAIRTQLYGILETLEEFDVDEPKKVEFEESPFPILNDLNKYLIELIDRIRINYQSNKQFTQNASHELQTPLAVIKGHIEILLQSPNIGEKEIESLAIVLQNTNRLSKLNSALILLSKIEHQRFSDTEKVSFEKMTEEVVGNFHDLIQIQGLEIQKNYSEKFEVEMSETLAEILIANLIQNAIRHNIEKGFIKIDINENRFSISNSGHELKVTPISLFKRFKRQSEVEESLGLGLSIVKRICEQSGMEVQYLFEDGLHTLTLKLSND
ncbi:HAMP domain-containing histidine kinase [Saprospiraceae bacterium]|nr:HAMP domain-containing histidine kinase [Bacteroidota bacterium]MDB4727531.1 HAMP domain-containing histidine kinase [Saprospiraceae bacterium]